MVHNHVKVKFVEGLNLYPHQTECFELKIVDLYTHSAGGKATGKQFFLSYLKI